MRSGALETVAVLSEARPARAQLGDILEKDGRRALNWDVDKAAAPFFAPPAFDQNCRLAFFAFAHPFHSEAASFISSDTPK
jgi:hypothetical protein